VVLLAFDNVDSYGHYAFFPILAAGSFAGAAIYRAKQNQKRLSVARRPRVETQLRAASWTPLRCSASCHGR